MGFNGFDFPNENWSKLPHAFVEKLAEIDSISEIKVVLYILRHTWGYSNYTEPKQISTSEFEKGIIGNNGIRLDAGCGVSGRRVILALKEAERDGYINTFVYTDSKNVVRKAYKLRMFGESTTHTEDDEGTLDMSEHMSTRDQTTPPDQTSPYDDPSGVPMTIRQGSIYKEGKIERKKEPPKSPKARSPKVEDIPIPEWITKASSVYFDFFASHDLLDLRAANNRSSTELQWSQEIFKLIRIDGYEEDVVKKVLRWLKSTNNWWIETKNIRTLRKLRSVTNGESFFHKLYISWQRDAAVKPKQDRGYDFK